MNTAREKKEGELNRSTGKKKQREYLVNVAKVRKGGSATTQTKVTNPRA
jgi:hypothetical protein